MKSVAEENVVAETNDSAPVALPRENPLPGTRDRAPEVDVVLDGEWVPPFSDFHSRLGSRLTFNMKFDPEDGGVETSSLGMPRSMKRGVLLGIEDSTGNLRLLPLFGPCGEASSEDGDRPAAVQILRQKMTLQSTVYDTDGGFRVEVSTPFARTTQLDPHSFDLRCQIAPVFLVTITMTNDGTGQREGRFVCGMDHALGQVDGDGWEGLAFRSLSRPEDALTSPPIDFWPAADRFSPENTPADTLSISVAKAPGLKRNMNRPCASQFGVLSVPFHVGPGQSATQTFLFSAYVNQPIQRDLRVPKPLYAYYCGIWPSHGALLDWAWRNIDGLRTAIRRFDDSVALDRFSAARRFICVLACRGYLENTTLAWDGTDNPNGVYFSFAEAGFSGGYVNTMDLIPDVMAWDLNFHPWTLVNSLRRFKEYTYRDKYGLSVMHDMGARDFQIEDQYRSDGGPWMMTEQAANFIHAVFAVWRFRGDKAWLVENREILRELTDSLKARDGSGDGIQDRVSDRGREGNTVDDGTILGSAAQNHYMAIKEWVAYRAAATCFSALGDEAYREIAGDEAGKIAAALHRHIAQHGRFWPSDNAEDPMHDISSIHLLKGLYTAPLAGMDLSDSMSGTLLADCRTHLDNTCRENARFYGYPLVPHDPWLTWNSHSIMVDVVADRLLGGRDLEVAERMSRAFYYSGIVNEFYNVRNPKVTNQWPGEQHYSRMANALGWVPGAFLGD